MKCAFCGNTLPQDSEFCQYCGKKIILIPENQINQCSCQYCGGQVNQKGHCMSCGKKASKRTGVAKMVVLSVVCIALIGLNVFQYIQGEAIRGELESANETIESQKATISEQATELLSKDREISNLNKRVKDYRNWWYDAAEKSDFLDDYIVIIGDSNKRYHKYGCEDLDLSSFHAYNVENAIYKGYKACSKCN